MTTAELLTRYRSLIAYDLDSVLGPLPASDDAEGNAAYDAGIVGYLNEAMVELAQLARLYDPAVTLALTAGQGRYPLSGNAFGKLVLEPYAVVIDGTRLRNAAGNDYGLWTLNELTRYHPSWMADDDGSPARAVFTGDALLLHPAPASDGTAYVDARVAPPPLSIDAPTASPDLPSRLHPAIAMAAVYRSCLPYSQTNAQVQRLTGLLSEATSIAESVGRDNESARVGSGSLNHFSHPQRMAV